MRFFSNDEHNPLNLSRWPEWPSGLFLFHPYRVKDCRVTFTVGVAHGYMYQAPPGLYR